MYLFIILIILSALFAALDQVIRFPNRFLPVSRLPEIFYTWTTHISVPYPVNAVKTYQGIKMWLMAAAWYFAPSMPWWLFLLIMIAWWALIRNFMLHTVLTKDERFV